jgi:hypothetical protein
VCSSDLLAVVAAVPDVAAVALPDVDAVAVAVSVAVAVAAAVAELQPEEVALPLTVPDTVTEVLSLSVLLGQPDEEAVAVPLGEKEEEPETEPLPL